MPSTSPKSPARRGHARIHVALVDQYPLFSEALGVAISREDDLDFVGSAANPDGAIDLITDRVVDVCVVDADFRDPQKADLDGIDVVRQIKEARPELRVLILAERMEVDTMARAASEGACGFLPKTSTLEEICRAIRTAKDGGMFVEQSLVAPLIERLRRGRSIAGGSARADITPREHEVLTLLGEGLDVTAISQRMEISINTARGHVRSLLIKLGAHSQLEAVVEAVHQ
jgi:DNA-binding NarL/FixJ family response regulator